MSRRWPAKRTPCSQGRVHASAAEARRCDELHLLQRLGAIRELQAHPQPSWSLDVGGEHVGRYTADWRYVDAETGRTVVEDYKGMPPSRDVVLRLKLMRGLHGIDVRIYPPRPAKRRQRKGAK